MYILLLAVIYLAFISLGLPDSLLGSAWPTLYAELGVPVSYMGIITMIISGGTIISSLLTDKVTAKFGTRRVTYVSTLLTAIALFGFSYSTKFYQLCLLGIPYGLGAGAIDASLNNYVALHYNSKHMSWLHCFWGVGTIISPYVMSYALTHSMWQNGYRTVSLIQVLIAIVIACSLPLWKVNRQKNQEEVDTKPIGLVGAIKIKGVPEIIIAFMAYCACESTAMLWTSSYFESAYQMSKEGAAALGSIFFIGMTFGRFMSGFFADKLGDFKMIKLGAAIAFAGIILTAVPIQSVAMAGFIITGLGCAPIYPCIIHTTPVRFGKEKSQSIIGVQMASAYFGATFMPPLFGILANAISFKLMPAFTGGFMLLMFLMIRKTERDTVSL